MESKTIHNHKMEVLLMTDKKRLNYMRGTGKSGAVCRVSLCDIFCDFGGGKGVREGWWKTGSVHQRQLRLHHFVYQLLFLFFAIYFLFGCPRQIIFKAVWTEVFVWTRSSPLLSEIYQSKNSSVTMCWHFRFIYQVEWRIYLRREDGQISLSGFPSVMVVNHSRLFHKIASCMMQFCIAFGFFKYLQGKFIEC